ncbi:MAG: hypothetical protein MRY83_05925 [Flavobacteriales bacterium]|nr:hypothetical protein [Flavobacteriales bacterium]
MSRGKYILSIFLSVSMLYGVAQNEIDALRYSRIDHGGSARYVGLGGAFGALGGDMSMIPVNPAGIAVFRKSQLEFSTQAIFNNVNSNHFGTSSSGYEGAFNLSNIGLVLSYEKDGVDWVSTHFGIVHNKTTTLEQEFAIQGVNDNNSLLDVYKDQIENGIFNEFGSNLAWQTFLIDSFQGQYYSGIPGYGQTQSNNVRTEGRISETTLAFGGNYRHKLYIGGSIGFPRVRYSWDSNFGETSSLSDSLAWVDRYNLSEELTTRGGGFNMKLGMIYRASDYLRLGASIHTPTWYSLTDNWSASMYTLFVDSTELTYDSPEGIFDYSLTTPFRASGSAAVLFGKKGLLSVDYTYTDFGQAKFRSDNYGFATENQTIKDNYVAGHEVRLGTEWRLNPFAIRAGYALQMNPYNKAVNNVSEKTTYSIGAGYRNRNFYLDLAYSLTSFKENYYLYSDEIIEPTELSFSNNRIVTTIGFRF